MTWFLDPDFNPEFRLSNMETTDSSLGFHHSLIQNLYQSVEKDWDLLRTVPTESHQIRLPDGRRKQMDLRLYENLAGMIACASVLPFKVRRKTVHHITQKHQCSIGIALLGVVWPEMKNGKPTLDSYPTSIGDTHITEVYGTGYKPLTSTPLLLIVYSFLKRLNLVLAASGSLFTRKETEDFMDLFMYVLQEDI